MQAFPFGDIVFKMDDKKPFFHLNYGRLSLMLGILGLCSCFFIFPSGIFIGFFFGFCGITSAVLAKKSRSFLRGSSVGLVTGILSLGISLLFFASLLSFYTMLGDPQAGPQFTKIMLRMLKDYQIPMEQFVKMMQF